MNTSTLMPALRARPMHSPARPRAAVRLARIGLGCALALPLAAVAQPPFTYDTRVINTPGQAVPVQIVTQPSAREVLCALAAGGGSSASPFFNLGVVTNQANVQCPDGVARVDVRQIAFTPDIGTSSALSAASFRVTVGFQQPGGISICPPAGILGMVTDGAPRAAVMQPFLLDTSGAATPQLCYRAFSTSGIAGHGTEFGGTIFFIGRVAP